MPKRRNYSAEFKGASYAQRYNLLCRKLIQEQLLYCRFDTDVTAKRRGNG